MVERIRDSLSICKDEGYDLSSFEIRSRYTGESDAFNVAEKNIIPTKTSCWEW